MTEILHQRTMLESTTLNGGRGGRSHTVLSSMPAPVQDFFHQQYPRKVCRWRLMLQRLFCSISISRIQPAKHQGSQRCSNCGHTSSPRSKQQPQAQHSTKAHEGVPTTNGGAGGRSRPSACVLTVHAQCTYSARTVHATVHAQQMV